MGPVAHAQSSCCSTGLKGMWLVTEILFSVSDRLMSEGVFVAHETTTS